MTLRALIAGVVALGAWAVYIASHHVTSRDQVRTATASSARLRPAPQTATTVRAGLSTLYVADPLAPGGRREVLVWRPNHLDTAGLPVVYFLHGLPGHATDWTQEGVVPVLETVVRSTGRPFVAAFPDGSTPGSLDTEWGDDVRGRVDLEQFVTGPVIDAVEGPNIRDREHRAIVGFSMGGFAAAAIALRHPDLYGQVASLAGYFHIDDPAHIFGNPSKHDPSQLLSAAPKTRFFLDDGTSDHLPVVRGETQRFTRLLRAHHMDVEERLTPGGHSVAWAVAQLGMVARFFDKGWGGR
jgi:S-formylglutathione hydrolase FrmB